MRRDTVEPKASNKIEPKASNKIEPKAGNKIEPKASNTDEEFLFEPMEPAHLDRVLAIERTSFPEPWTRSIFMEGFRPENRIRQMVAREPRARAIVGYVGYRVVADEMEILNLAVDPGWRRRGLGSRMIHLAREEARAQGVRNVYLEVRPSNEPARKLYQRFGFRVEGVRRGYYNHPAEDALVMVLRLERPVGRAEGEQYQGKAGGTMEEVEPKASNKTELRERARRENRIFRALELKHRQLEEQLEELARRRVLTPAEEIEKKRVQKEKLVAKDRMADILRKYEAAPKRPVSSG